jgi:hypothetical protein
VTQLTLWDAFPAETLAMGTHSASHPISRSRTSPPSPLSLLLFAALLCCGAPQGAQALDRDITLEFLPPENGGEISGYNVYAIDEGSGALQLFDAGLPMPDANGVARTIVALARESAYRVTMTAYGSGGESEDSNARLVPAENVCDPASCDDGDPCTLDSCDAEGCIGDLAPDGTVCDDGFVDTVDDQCRAGSCDGTLLVCRGDFDCDDENACNGSETCDSGRVCLSGTPLDCRAPGPCQVAGCDPSVGCVVENRPDGATCDDGQLDTKGDVCVAGSCQGVASGGDDELPGLSLDEISPSQATRGRHTLVVRGKGFQLGTRLAFTNGNGPAPKVRALTLIDETRMEADIEVSRKGPKRATAWDATVTLPDGTSALLPQALVTTK